MISKAYEKADFEVVEFSLEDVLTNSAVITTAPTVPGTDPSNSVETTAKDEGSNADNKSDDASEGMNPIIWIVIAVAVVGVGAVIIVFITKKKAN